jgi:hypothetical protein
VIGSYENYIWKIRSRKTRTINAEEKEEKEEK